MRITLWIIHALHCRMNQRVVVYARRERRPRYNHPFNSKIVSFGLRWKTRIAQRLTWYNLRSGLNTGIALICTTLYPRSFRMHKIGRPTSYQAPWSTYLVPVPSQPQPLVITIPSASFFAPKVPKIPTLRPIPKPMVITYPPSKGRDPSLSASWNLTREIMLCLGITASRLLPNKGKRARGRWQKLEEWLVLEDVRLHKSWN